MDGFVGGYVGIDTPTPQPHPPNPNSQTDSFAADAEKPSARALVNRMADLLLNSYFPQGQGVTGSKQVRRKGGGGLVG